MPFYVYCIVESDAPNGPCKVGVATNLSKRLSSLQGGNWRELRTAWIVELQDRAHALSVESHILSRLRPDIYRAGGSRRRLKSEWIDASPHEAAAAGQMLIDAYLEAA
ncbi:hypothetical protein ACVIYH_009094 [Bradyrhizobium diazoefficiens]